MQCRIKAGRFCDRVGSFVGRYYCCKTAEHILGNSLAVGTVHVWNSDEHDTPASVVQQSFPFPSASSGLYYSFAQMLSPELMPAEAPFSASGSFEWLLLDGVEVWERVSYQRCDAPRRERRTTSRWWGRVTSTCWCRRRRRSFLVHVADESRVLVMLFLVSRVLVLTLVSVSGPVIVSSRNTKTIKPL